MIALTLTRCLAALLLTCAAARADFQNGQYASLALGELAPDQDFESPSGVAVDPVTHKVFVADRNKNRVLRFDKEADKSNGANANGVQGQVLYTTSCGDAGPAHLSQPAGLAVENGQLWT